MVAGVAVGAAGDGFGVVGVVEPVAAVARLAGAAGLHGCWALPDRGDGCDGPVEGGDEISELGGVGAGVDELVGPVLQELAPDPGERGGVPGGWVEGSGGAGAGVSPGGDELDGGVEGGGALVLAGGWWSSSGGFGFAAREVAVLLLRCNQ